MEKEKSLEILQWYIQYLEGISESKIQDLKDIYEDEMQKPEAHGTDFEIIFPEI